MRILFTICGRAGSKGVKNKNIKLFLDKSLPLYTLSAIDLYTRNNAQDIVDIALNTDSMELISIVTESKLKKPDIVERREELAGDMVPKSAVIFDTYLEMKKRYNTRYDVVVDLDITSPLRTVKDIEGVIQKQRSTRCDVAFSVTHSRRSPYFNMVRKSEKGYVRVIKSDFVARQQAPEIFDMNASIYAYSPQFLESEKSIFEGYCEIFTMMDTGILDIDNENDLELMEVVAKWLYTFDKQYEEIYNNIR